LDDPPPLEDSEPLLDVLFWPHDLVADDPGARHHDAGNFDNQGPIEKKFQHLSRWIRQRLEKLFLPDGMC